MLNYLKKETKLSEVIARLSDLNERGYEACLKATAKGLAIQYDYTRVGQ